MSTSVTRLDNGRYQVDAQLAIKEWQKHTHSNMDDDTSKPDNDGSYLTSQDIPPYRISRQEQKYYQAKLVQLKYEKDKGNLIKKDDVERLMALFMAKVQTEFMALPGQLSPLLTAEDDASNVRHLLDCHIKTIVRFRWTFEKLFFFCNLRKNLLIYSHLINLSEKNNHQDG